MKNTFLYYLAITIPFGIIVWMIRNQTISLGYLTLLFFSYLLVYRPYIDGKRLVAKNKIDKKDIWKMILPGNQIKYFRELYLN